MKQRFILYRRKVGGMFYVEDTQTKKQESLGRKTEPKPSLSSMLEMKPPGSRS